MRKLLKQGIAFVGISGIGWIMDFVIFNLLNLRSSYVAVNNMISSLVAVCFVFCVSTRKTFVQKDGGIPNLYFISDHIDIIGVAAFSDNCSRVVSDF